MREALGHERHSEQDDRNDDCEDGGSIKVALHVDAPLYVSARGLVDGGKLQGERRRAQGAVIAIGHDRGLLAPDTLHGRRKGQRQPPRGLSNLSVDQPWDRVHVQGYSAVGLRPCRPAQGASLYRVITPHAIRAPALPAGSLR